jgi:malonyl-CoA/methylmalonyl-CoA synthetase
VTPALPTALEGRKVSAYALAAWALHAGRTVTPEEIPRRVTTARSLPHAFAATARRVPERAALHLGTGWVTHAQVDSRAARWAGWLREHEVGPGTTVLLAAPTGLEMAHAYLAVLRTGATVLLTDPRSTSEELRLLVEDSGAQATITGGGSTRRLLDFLGGERHLHIGLASDDGTGHSPQDLDAGPPVPPQAASPEAVALLAYTSGTTGRPKPVPLTHGALLASMFGVLDAWRWREDDVLVHALPLSHQHGLSGMHAALLTGARTRVLPRFDVGNLREALIEEAATALFAVPAIHRRIVEEWQGDPEPLRACRLITSGSAGLPPTLATQVKHLAGQLPLERYGSTEAGLNVSNLLLGPRRIGAIGLPLPGVEVAVVDEDLTPLGTGTVGELLVRGPQVFGGYGGSEDIQPFTPGGWFRTGDLVRVDADTGAMTIVGRRKDVVISGGENVYPAEVEAALLRREGVTDAAVTGVPSARWGEEVVALLVADAQLDLDGVLTTLRRELSPHKVPKRLLRVDDLPRNHLGKVIRAEVTRIAVARQQNDAR